MKKKKKNTIHAREKPHMASIAKIVVREISIRENIGSYDKYA